MNKFNLTFSGQILTGQDPAQVKRRFGKMFAIDDPERVERFFTGQTVILRRNLERKAAAQYFHELHLLGAVAALVKVTADSTADTTSPAALAKQDSSSEAKAAASPEQSKDAGKNSQQDASNQLWPVSSRTATKQRKEKAEPRPSTANKPLNPSPRDTLNISARVKEEKEDARRQAEQEVVRKEAEREREKAEIAAKQKSEQQEKKRLSAERAARLKAEQEEKQRVEAEQAAKLQAEREEQQRLAAEKAAKLQAEREEQQRGEVEKAAKLQSEVEEQQRRETEEAARLQAELEDIKRQETEELSRVRAASLLKQSDAERRSAERLRAATGSRADQSSPHGQNLQTPRPKEAVETLREGKRQTPPRKSQPGEPNLYKLRPFRNTDEVRNRFARAAQRKRKSYTLAALSLVAVLITAERFFHRPAEAIITGASAIAIDNQSGPLLLAGDTLLLHDRAGLGSGDVSLSALRLSALQPPMAFDSTGALLALGQLVAENEDTAGDNTSQLLRCDLKQSKCQPFSPHFTGSIRAFVVHPLDGSVLLADTGQLVKLNRDGEIVARADVALPDHPVLRLHAGLLFANSAEGPGISVYRYEDSAFGEQLDEILLLPPAALQAEQSTVGDFLFSGGTWWASLLNPQSGSVGLYRFDDEWNSLSEVTLPVTTGPLQLTSWGQKTLVNDFHSATIQRFNAQGMVEAPFVSSQLEDLVNGRQRRVNLMAIAWRSGLLLCVLVAIVALGFGYLQGLRQLVYKPRRERGAEPVDGYADTLHWIDPVPNRPALLRHRALSYGALLIATLLLAVAQSVTVWQLAALLVALSGPLIALLLLGRHPIGHIGILKDRLLLVDHSGMYHLAGGSSVKYRGPFLLIDDVVVFSGSRLLPAFSSAQIQAQVRPLATGGVQVDYKTILVKLLQSQHPFALGALAILASTIAAVVLLCLQGLF